MHIIVCSEVSQPIRRFLYAALIMLLSGVADAATFIVDRFDDPFPLNTCNTAVANDCSVREAVIAANNSADLDGIQIPAGLYTLTREGSLEDGSIFGDLDILEPVLISGAGMDLTIIDGGGANGIQDTIFHILSAPGTEILNLTLQGSEADTASPGGVRVDSHLTLRNVRIRNNDSPFVGGCLVGLLGVLRIVDSEIIANTGFGGGCYNQGDLTIERSLIANNVATAGGAIFVSGGDLYLDRVTLQSNTAAVAGGAIYHDGGISRISDSVISGNQAISGDGGAVFINAFSRTSDSVISGNQAISGNGGAVFISGGAVYLDRVTVDSNTAGGNGGAAYVETGTLIKIIDSTLSSNSAFQSAAVEVLDGTVEIGNTTISGNTSSAQFTLAATGTGQMTLEHVTFYDNDGMGQEISAVGLIEIGGSVIQGTCIGTNFLTLTGNIESPGNTCGFIPVLDIANVADVGLMPLADYGGPTQTHLPLPDSIALDSNLTCIAPGLYPNDQRGMTRPVQSTNLGVRCDSGAVEYQGGQTLDLVLDGDGTVTSVPAGIDCGATCSAVFETGTIVQLTATPNPGSVHIGWSLLDCSGPSCAILMNSSRTAIAYFNPAFVLSTAIQGSGTGTLTSQPAGINCPSQCSGQFLANSNITLTATPAPGSSIVGWSEAACGVNSACPINMSQNQSVSVFLSDPEVLFKSSFESIFAQMSE